MTQKPEDQLDRPLGRDKRRARRLPRLPGAGAVALVVMGCAVVAGSAAIALHEAPFRESASPVAVADEPRSTGSVAAPVEEADRLDAEPGESSEPDTRRERKPGSSIVDVGPSPEGRDSVLIIRDPSALEQNPRVAHLPDKDLLEDSPDGPLPVRAADGRRPFEVHARPWSGARGARVAIVIGGLGVSQTGTQRAIDTLPSEVTLAFAAGGNSLDRWMQAARREGHEIVMQVPLEPFDYPNVDPGRNTLTVDADAEENLGRLHWALSRITNYTGVMNYMGARFTAHEEAMRPVMRDLGERGLLYLDDGTSARSTAAELAERNGVPFASVDTTIDAERSRGDILKKLDELERIARSNGYAVGTGWAFDTTVAAVADWAREAKGRGIEIVPVSAVADDPETRQANR